VDVQLRCVSIDGDGVGTAIAHDGGLLGSILALAAKGELPHFQAGLILEVVTMDAWYWDNSFVKRLPAVYILQGLCRRCCLPELILRCLQLRVFLAAFEDRLEEDQKLIDFVSSRETALYGLFSQRQLQEFLLLEAEVTIRSMEFTGDDFSVMQQ
jgi:nuclear pore complex protein Nup107